MNECRLSVHNPWGWTIAANLSVLHAPGIRTTNEQTKHRQHHSTEYIWRTLQHHVNARGMWDYRFTKLCPDRLGNCKPFDLQVQLHHEIADADPEAIHDVVGQWNAMPCRSGTLNGDCKPLGMQVPWIQLLASTITHALECEPSSNNQTGLDQSQLTPTIQSTVH